MNRQLGALGQMAAMKVQGPKPPKPMDLSAVDQNLQRSGNMLRKGISRMRQMNRGGKVKLAEGGKVSKLKALVKVAKPSPARVFNVGMSSLKDPRLERQYFVRATSAAEARKKAAAKDPNFKVFSARKLEDDGFSPSEIAEDFGEDFDIVLHDEGT